MQAKSAQARSRKGHEGEAICEEDDACTSEQLPNDKQPEDPDVHSHEHAVSAKKLLVHMNILLCQSIFNNYYDSKLNKKIQVFPSFQLNYSDSFLNILCFVKNTLKWCIMLNGRELQTITSMFG